LAKRDGDQALVRVAILTSLQQGASRLLAVLASDPAYCGTLLGRSMLESLATLIGTQLRAEEVARFEKTLVETAAADQKTAPELVRGYLGGRSKAPTERRKEIPVSAQVNSVLQRFLSSSEAQILDPQQPVSARLQAIRMFGVGSFEQFEKLGTTLLDHRQPQELQLAAVETLGKFNVPAVGTLLTGAWPRLSPKIQTAALDVIFSRPAWLVALLDAIESGRIAAGELGPSRMQSLAGRADAIGERYRKLARDAVSSRAEVIKSYQSSLALTPDLAKGKIHFQKICASCHRVENTGYEIGPNLATFKARGAEAILLNVLDPNREVNPQYVNYVATLDDGRTLSGMIAEESAASIVLKRGENATDTINRTELEELRSTRQSIMPEGLEKQLDPQALADVIGYLLNAP